MLWPDHDAGHAGEIPDAPDGDPVVAHQSCKRDGLEHVRQQPGILHLEQLLDHGKGVLEPRKRRLVVLELRQAVVLLEASPELHGRIELVEIHVDSDEDPSLRRELGREVYFSTLRKRLLLRILAGMVRDVGNCIRSINTDLGRSGKSMGASWRSSFSAAAAGLKTSLGVEHPTPFGRSAGSGPFSPMPSIQRNTLSPNMLVQLVDGDAPTAIFQLRLQTCGLALLQPPEKRSNIRLFLVFLNASFLKSRVEHSVA